MSRLLFTTLLITFAALTGCSGGGGPPTAEENTPAETIDVDLAGTWNGELIVNEVEAAKANPDTMELIKTMKMQMTFTEDGKLQLAGETNGQPYQDENTWLYVDQQNNVLKIRSVTTDGKEKDHEFFFNSSDSFDMPLNIETAQVGAMRFTRLR